MKVDIEDKLDAIGGLYDAWRTLQNTRDFTAEINLPKIDAAQADIDKLIIALTEEVVYLRRGWSVDPVLGTTNFVVTSGVNNED